MSGSPSPARSLANEPGERAWAGEADTLPAVDFDGFQAEAFGENLPPRLTHLWRPAAEQGLGPGDAATIFFIRALVGDVTFVTDCSASSSATSAFLRYSSAHLGDQNVELLARRDGLDQPAELRLDEGQLTLDVHPTVGVTVGA